MRAVDSDTRRLARREIPWVALESLLVPKLLGHGMKQNISRIDGVTPLLGGRRASAAPSGRSATLRPVCGMPEDAARVGIRGSGLVVEKEQGAPEISWTIVGYPRGGLLALTGPRSQEQPLRAFMARADEAAKGSQEGRILSICSPPGREEPRAG
jgi:hypothetical protein